MLVDFDNATSIRGLKGRYAVLIFIVKVSARR